MSKSILRPLTVVEFRQNAGTRMTSIGKRRKKKVAEILADAMKRGSTFGATARRLKEQANTPSGKDNRDWMRVVQTEYTTAKANASLDLIVSIFGEDASVYRDPQPQCCEKCSKLFKGKKFRAGSVPEALKGAIHPFCVCGTWKTVEMPDLTKAMDPLADVPMGVVKREVEGKGWRAEISTGTGYWVPMDSITGRSVMRVTLMNCPAVLCGKSGGCTIMAHGRWNTRMNPYSLYSLAKMGSARFYPRDITKIEDPHEKREKSATQVVDLSGYLDSMRAILPVVALMPEYWESGAPFRYLTDFMGFKTMTDWLVVVPGEPPLDAFLGTHSPKDCSQRRAVRAYTKQAMHSANLRKDAT